MNDATGDENVGFHDFNALHKANKEIENYEAAAPVLKNQEVSYFSTSANETLRGEYLGIEPYISPKNQEQSAGIAIQVHGEKRVVPASRMFKDTTHAADKDGHRAQFEVNIAKPVIENEQPKKGFWMGITPEGKALIQVQSGRTNASGEYVPTEDMRSMDIQQLLELNKN